VMYGNGTNDHELIIYDSAAHLLEQFYFVNVYVSAHTAYLPFRAGCVSQWIVSVYKFRNTILCHLYESRGNNACVYSQTARIMMAICCWCYHKGIHVAQQLHIYLSISF
jgi:hypothetical protein